MSQNVEFLPPADPNVTCSPELRTRVMHEFKNYHKAWTRRRTRIRMTVIGSIGLVLMLCTYMMFHRLAPKMDPIHDVQDAQKVPHPGIPPKPPQITPPPLDQPAIQRHLPPRYPKYPQKLPKTVGGGNYTLL